MNEPTWDDGQETDLPLPGIMGWVIALLRAVPLAILVFGGLAVLLLVRLVERPICGIHRPVTPLITQFVCRNALRIMGIKWRATGTPLQGRGAMVANHSSWLDIFSLNAATSLYFVSKSEVANWPGIGWLARATGTVFIERNRAKAKEQTKLFEARLLDGHKLLFFPEGTSTDGMQVIPFKTTLFQSFLTDTLKNEISVQPVSVFYRAPVGASPRHYGWWGDMSFGAHLLHTLSTPRQGAIDVRFFDPIPVAEFDNRKDLAAASEAQVRAGHLASQNAR
jgi:1-acyl-sn-glycerol-3-phosphate acyltransferase